jgi:hypothetical protein
MLIPVNQPLLQIQQYLEEHPDEDDVPDREEALRMLRVLIDFCWESLALRTYGKLVAGKPNSN